MILNAKRHDGAMWLARHLIRTDQNERVSVAISGLVSTDVKCAFRELAELSVGCRTKKPTVHVIANPASDLSQDEWSRFWLEFEQEFGVVGHPYVSVTHLKYGKGGRRVPHEHRLYLWLDSNARVVPDGYMAIRCQKLARIAEVRLGEPLVSGKHNRVVIEKLLETGYEDVAQAMIERGLDNVERPQSTSFKDRAMTERLCDIATDEVGRRAYEAYLQSGSPQQFEARLLKSGLILCTGTKTLGVMTSTGAFHDLRRCMAIAARAADTNAPRKREIVELTEGVVLSSYSEVSALVTQKRPPQDSATVTGEVQREQSLRSCQADAVVSDTFSEETPPRRFLKSKIIVDKLVQYDSHKRFKLAEFAHQLDDETLQLVSGVFDAIMQVHAEPSVTSEGHFLDALETMPSFSIHPPTPADVFKADLANVDSVYGPEIHYVHLEPFDRRIVDLKSGCNIDVRPEVIRTQNPDVRAVEIAFAIAVSAGHHQIVLKADQDWINELVGELAVKFNVEVLDAVVEVVDDRSLEEKPGDLMTYDSRLTGVEEQVEEPRV
jgi:hypothetical protein